MKYQDYYATMGVARDADESAIKKAYRKLARKYHPDVSTEKDAEEKFKALGEAYEVLKDPEKRAAYDQLGTGFHAGQDFQPPPGWGQYERSGHGTGGEEFDVGDLSDFFSSLFGEGRRARSAAPKGRDAHARIFITLEDLYAGKPVLVSLTDPGTGEERQLRVTVPKDIRDGQSFRLKGQANSGAKGIPPGDIYLELRTIPHPKFTVDGDDVYSQVDVSPWEAVLGAQVPVETLGSTIKLTIPPRSRSGTRLRVKNRGLPGSKPGHQYVTLTVQVPETVTDEELREYKVLAEKSTFDPRQQT